MPAASGLVLPSEAQNLHYQLTKLLPKGGHEVMRQGGSSGETVVNINLFKFLSSNTSFPRKANRVKLIQRKHDWDAV